MDVYRSRSADTLTRTLFKASETRQRKSTSRRSRKNTSPPHFYFPLNGGFFYFYIKFSHVYCDTYNLKMLYTIWKSARKKCSILIKRKKKEKRDTFMRSVRNVSKYFNTFNVKRQCFVDVASYFFGSVKSAMSTKRRCKMQRTRSLLRKQ